MEYTLQEKLERVARLWSFGPLDARCEAERLGLTSEQFQQAVAMNRAYQDEHIAHYNTTGRAY